ncbi:hypothetical protein ACH5RR_003610 [Cinchona calisaya]|uniref:Uncharacterized protein n=1 Tax=Cinchona calisaya TaxID=153742 RepID=A0ABD3AVC5_9GENT
MQIQFGSKPFVIASSPEMAKEFLQTHDNIFASRPPTAAGKYISYNNSDVTWAPYGPYWRQGRKIYLTELLNAKRLDSYEYIRVHERRALISRLYGLSGTSIVLRDHFYRFTLSTITRTVLGKKYFTTNQDRENKGVVTFEELKDILDRWFVLNGVINIGDVIPWLSVFDLQGYLKQMKVLQKDFDKFLDFVLDDHEENMKEEKDFVPKDMVDIFLKLAEDPSLRLSLLEILLRAEDVCLEEVYGFTTHPKVPIALILEPRLASHLYN